PLQFCPLAQPKAQHACPTRRSSALRRRSGRIDAPAHLDGTPCGGSAAQRWRKGSLVNNPRHRPIGWIEHEASEFNGGAPPLNSLDRKSTRLNSSHVAISYAVSCFKK